MNGLHDMGGVHGMGPIVVGEPKRQQFAAVWEGKVHALSIALGAWRGWNVDQFRQEIERIPGPEYMRLTYYEKWLAALVNLSINAGLFTRAELDSGKAEPGAERRIPCLPPDQVHAALMAGASSSRPVDGQPLFEPGDAVRARNIHSQSHTRLPRYVRGHRGTIMVSHGAHIFADAGARGDGEAPEPMYTVSFLASELWGAAKNPADAVFLNLWESYLEPA